MISFIKGKFVKRSSTSDYDYSKLCYEQIWENGKWSLYLIPIEAAIINMMERPNLCRIIMEGEYNQHADT